MTPLFPYDNVVAGCLVLVVGFGFHWIGQLISILDWGLAERLGLQEKGMVPEFKVYEHGIAVADVAIGWIYAIAGVGLVLGTPWGYVLAFFPGSILLYHAISFWGWTANQRKAGHTGYSPPARFAWIAANLATGLLAILVAWRAA